MSFSITDKYFDPAIEFRILIFLIVLFSLWSFIFLIITIIRRQKKINNAILQKTYEAQIESHIFSYLFENNLESINAFKNITGFHSSLFQKVTMKYCINLHISYSGTLQDKILDFLIQTKLIQYPRKKLQSNFWKHKIEAIRDLSTLKDTDSMPYILKLIEHPNKNIATESLLALIKYKGLSTLKTLEKYDNFIDDWSQALIIAVIKNHKIVYDPVVENLLNSKNKSLQLLATRVIQFYK